MTQRFSNTLTFEVLEPRPRVRTGIELRVFGPDGQTFLDILSDSTSRQWVEVLNEEGSGQFQLGWGNPKGSPANLKRGNVVRCYLDGRLRFAFRIQQKKLKAVDQGGVPTPAWEVSGPGVPVILQNGIVYPEGGVSALASDPRLMTFASRDFDPATGGFTAAVELGTVASPPNPDWQPEDFPDQTAQWVAGEAYSGAMTSGWTYLVKDVVLTGTNDLRISAAGDDTFTVWFAGAEVLTPDTPNDAFETTYKADLKQVPPGTYRVAVQLRNGGTTAGFVASIATVVGGELDTVVAATGSDWQALLDPTIPPGLTPGAAVKVLLDEAKARGACGQVNLGFDETVDSAGVPWDQVLDIGLSLGVSLLDVMKELATLGLDWQLTADLTLHLWRDGRGVDRSQQTSDLEPITFVPADLLVEGGVEEDGDVVNSLLLHTPSGWVVRDNPASIAEWDRAEGFLSLGNALTETEAFRSADAELDKMSQPRFATSVTLTERQGRVPYEDWRVGDTVLAPSGPGTLSPQRVRALAVGEDGNGNPTFVPELSTLAYEREEAHQRWLKRMANGTLGGTALTAAPNRSQSGTLTGRSGGTSTTPGGSTSTSGGTVQMATTVEPETTPGQAANVGVSGRAARQDHTHGTPPVPTAADVGAAETGHTHEFDGDVVILQEVYTVLEVTQAEYDALTPDANTLYLIV